MTSNGHTNVVETLITLSIKVWNQLPLNEVTNVLSVFEKKHQSIPYDRALIYDPVINYVKEIYEPFTDEEISNKIAELLKDETIAPEVSVIYQKVSDLHKACPKNLGDWYFTGDYPTVGGNRVVNRAFINYVEGNLKRAY